MAIAVCKSELVDAVIEEYAKLTHDLRRVPVDRARERTMPGHAARMLMSPSDLLAYLIGWNTCVLSWHEQRAAGVEPVLPAPGFAWNQLGELAASFSADHADASWADLRTELDRAKNDIVRLIDGLSDEDLYGAPWYRTYTAGRMIQLNTSSPYANARRRLRAWLRENEL